MNPAAPMAAPLGERLAAHGMLPQVELAIMSRVGGRSHNEDACGHWHSDRHLCCVVADGAGGHGGGDFASRLAVRHIIEQFAAAPLSRPDEVHDLLLDTNATVIQHRSDGPRLANMHTTVVGLFIDLAHGLALWGHAGDSRMYLFRGGQMLAHTHDHSVVQSLVEAGLLQPHQTHNHPRRSELLSALGTQAEHLRITTATKPWNLRDGDVFLLCTDGLWEYANEVDLSASLARAADPKAWLTALEDLVLRHAAAANNATHDNFSAITVWIGRDH